MKRYILIAGTNGVGKTTLYYTVPSIQDVPKINLDEEVRKRGDWKDQRIQYEAGAYVVKRIREYFRQGTSFSQETTLCGHSILKNIDKAIALGYYIEMHYVGVESVEISKKRVENRVAKGGHGVPEKDLERRFDESFKNLKTIIPKCNKLVLYDNTEDYFRFATYINGELIWLFHPLPVWYTERIGNPWNE